MSNLRILTESSSMKTVLRHALFWAIMYLVYTYMISFYGDFSKYLLFNLGNVPMFMLAYYLLRYVQIPYLYNEGKIGLFVISLLASSLIIFAIFLGLWELWLNGIFGSNRSNPLLSVESYMIRTIRYYSLAFALLTWESYHERRKEKERMQQLETEKLATELKFLKAQINPHFLFNTLNNLYSYVVTESPKAPDMILRLSGILDYVFYKSQNETVSLSEEIATIENFLGLEQIRYGDRLQVDYKTEGNMSAQISPLILLSLVENAFKHGASGDIDSPKIKIDIQEKNGSIHCEVWNTKSKHQGELNDAYKEGIGLSNIKRQLNLIYPNNHQLDIDDRERAFNVKLILMPKE